MRELRGNSGEAPGGGDKGRNGRNKGAQQVRRDGSDNAGRGGNSVGNPSHEDEPRADRSKMESSVSRRYFRR